jgi:geranylgeranyl diphosphate synthase, type II
VNIGDYFQHNGALTDHWLDRLMPAVSDNPAIIHEAMRYSLFAGGKRLRPILAIATGELFGAKEDDLLPVACSLEMIHTYSLIHDDLPAMDDDDLRRGMPTCHVKFGEAIAILAGDALLTQAFITLASLQLENPVLQLALLRELSTASGTTNALIGGQVLDLTCEGKTVSTVELEQIHRAKTGALIRCAVRMGAIVGRASSRELAALSIYGEKIGLAFQIADDLLDETATTAELGKTVGKDAATQKATYTSLYGVEGALQMANSVVEEALDSLRQVDLDAAHLEAIARFIIDRRS